LKLKHRKLAGAEVILEQDGWHCPLCLDRDPIRTGHCPTCSEKLVWKEAGSGGGDVFCPNGCWNAHYYTGHDETFWKQFAR